ncbi:uncharacterized protein LOC100180157 [Ciona intestinalis]
MWQGYSFLVSFNVVLMVTSQRNTNPPSTHTLPSFTKFEAKYMYGMVLNNVNPVAATLVKDRRYSNQITSKFDLVFMSHYQTSNVQSVFDVSQKVNSPESMRSETKLIADTTSIQYPNNVGRLPSGSIEIQPGYVWWIASGKLESDFSTNAFSGGIYLLDITARQWLPVAIHTEAERGFSSVAWLIWTWTTYVDDASKEQQKADADYSGGKANHNTHCILTDVLHPAFPIADSDNDWTQLNRIRSYVISSAGPFISIETADLNGDGKVDILTSVAARPGDPGKIIAFETPRSPSSFSQVWRKHVLHTFPPSSTLFSRMSPGPAIPFKAHAISHTRNRLSKPHILVSGQDDKKAYVLSPDVWSRPIWRYSIQTILSKDCVVQSPAAQDVDGDGNAELFIPCGNTVHVMKYQPKSAANRIQAFTSIVVLLCSNLIFQYYI